MVLSNKIIPKTALISVSDKTGIVSFARFLQKSGVKIIATGGTAIKLKENLTHIQLCRKTKRKCDTQEKLFEGELPTNVEEQIKPRAHSTFFK